MGVMVTGGVVDLHVTSDGGYKFMIPVRRRRALSRDGGGMAGIAVCLPMLAQVHGPLEECFKTNGPPGLALLNSLK